ncbi:MAG: PEPxxWA-CTERM sorting domain-containing protein [Phenylobacterium sp.]|uniref:PEPxxWA-CTERM sorting domain-containing protein n=1 Tax=Phenylobacterium sp. TaxID=1871053 RepID=UPI001A533450|nr:PEPxxWA-CTERM sorting domain-containing protein [Phenylobacterium sp.]MBL8772971.1 PEPxxWA-CTERM sorting domain-containing protein [Phenylobacterium sp.]
MRTALLAFTAALALAGAPASAAIVWSAPVDSTGKSTDVINTGAFVDAITFGAATTVNGVSFTSVGLGLPNAPNYGVLTGFGQFGPGWDPEYRTLVESTSYFVAPTQLQLGFGVLPMGSYVIQLFMPQWDANWATRFSLNGVSSAPVQAGGAIAGGPSYPGRAMPQWISVQFDADGATDFTLLTESETRYQLLSALQIRTAAPDTGAVPEPGTWLLMILGFGLAGAALRRAAPAAGLARAAARV